MKIVPLSILFLTYRFRYPIEYQILPYRFDFYLIDIVFIELDSRSICIDDLILIRIDIVSNSIIVLYP